MDKLLLLLLLVLLNQGVWLDLGVRWKRNKQFIQQMGNSAKELLVPPFRDFCRV